MGWLLFPGYLGSTLGSPVVHWSHGNVGRGFASLGLSLVGMVAFSKLLPSGCDRDGDAPEGDDTCSLNSRALVPIGAPVGALVALGIDASLLAYDDSAPSRPKVSVLPWVAPNEQGAQAGVTGSF